MRKYCFLFFFLFLMPCLVEARLSFETQYKFDQAKSICEDIKPSENKFMIKEAQMDTSKNCVIKEFARLLVEDANHWTENEAQQLLNECQQQFYDDEDGDQLDRCMNTHLADKVTEISKPCEEINAPQCRNYVDQFLFDAVSKKAVDDLSFFEKILYQGSFLFQFVPLVIGAVISLFIYDKMLCRKNY